MKYISLVFFWAAYFLLLSLKRNGLVHSGFAANHLTDLLCVPLLLSTIQVILKVIKGPETKITSGMVCFSVIYLSVTFEWLLPKYDTRHTADLLDVLCYGIGGCFFVLTNNVHFKNIIRLPAG